MLNHHWSTKKKDSTSGSSKGTKSQPKSTGKSVQSEEPVFEVADSDMPQDQAVNLGDNEDEPRDETASRRDWFKKPILPQEPTDPDWNVGKTTQELDQHKILDCIIKTTQRTRSSYAELRIDFEDCFKALLESLIGENHKGGFYPFDLSKPFLLIPHGITKAAQYDLPGIENMVPNIWSLVKVSYDKYALWVYYVSVLRKHGSRVLEEIVVRRVDNAFYRSGSLLGCSLEDWLFRSESRSSSWELKVIKRRSTSPGLILQDQISGKGTRILHTKILKDYIYVVRPQEDPTQEELVDMLRELYKFSDGTLTRLLSSLEIRYFKNGNHVNGGFFLKGITLFTGDLMDSKVYSNQSQANGQSQYSSPALFANCFYAGYLKMEGVKMPFNLIGTYCRSIQKRKMETTPSEIGLKDQDIYSLNYMPMGAGKTWYVVSRDVVVAFENVVRVHGVVLSFAYVAIFIPRKPDTTEVMGPRINDMISSPFEGLSDIGSPGVVGPEHEGLPWMLDDPYVQVALQAPPSPDYIPAFKEPQSPPLPDFVLEPSPDYVPESDPKEDLEEDDDEDPEEDPVDYPADGGDNGDDEDEPSDDDEDEEVDIEADDEEEEEHPAPVDSIAVALPAANQAPSAKETEPFETDESAATPPPHPAYRVTARISIPAPVPTPVWSDAELPSPPLPPILLPLPVSPPLPQIPSPPLLVSSPVPVLSPSPPASPIRPLGYRAAMIRLRAEAASTSHSLPLPPPIIPSHTRPDVPSSGIPPLHLLSTDRREDRLEARGLREDYGFVATIDWEIRRDLERDVRYGITDSWDEIIEAMRDTDEVYTRLDDEQTRRHLLAGRLNMLFRDRRAHARTARLMETEARMSREAWGRSMDASDLARAEVMSLRTTMLAQQSEIRELQSADRRRQTVITEMLAADHKRRVQLTKALKLVKRLHTQMAELQR
ncbi:hypothetical protein Tco_1384679 [Tanacetum coccineum]